MQGAGFKGPVFSILTKKRKRRQKKGLWGWDSGRERVVEGRSWALGDPDSYLIPSCIE